MATRIYAVNPGGQNFDVIEDVGPTATSAIIALVVDLDTSLVTGAGGTARGPKLDEVLEALENIKAHIMRTNLWPPA